MSKDTGGPAFPWGEHGTVLGGMTLRDYFAAKAMASMHTNPYWDDKSYRAIADAAYQQADAMLAEREKKQ
ncbi:MAG: hypothetical protein Tp138OMZ00d2C19078221_53 [Prokaryotic dsDNA virus sp.]|jgi:hypothetical protein|nr:hypothetical protein [Pseudomonadales bacterium]QDP67481.1 MAG: hypothetical protein Tp138OMZ00d2C19078221_53 [Prokaryotic dsDNA virus sp.]|tara:strand:- start:137 stop:346 length:210 start_codon:yes stop_codon:yes gene_type:complete